MSFGVILWSALLPVVAAVNVVAWTLAAAALRKKRGELSSDHFATRRLHLVLSAGYLFGCAFRSVVPVFDIPRISLVDSWLATALVGRSVATIAELCFVGQWALILWETSQVTGSRVGRATARVVVPFIFVAEICSWYSVLTTSNLGHTFEESLWAVSAALMVASMLAAWGQWDARWRPAVAVLSVLGSAYVAYMCLVDVPMYWSRWMNDESHGRVYLSLAQGLADTGTHRVVSYRWQDWRTEIGWMSLYFSVAVWISIWFIHAPVLKPQRASARLRQPARAASWRLGAASGRWFT